MSVVDDVKAKMAATIEHLKQELRSIRTGRANPGLVEGVVVDVYGSHTRLKDVATISVPEARQLLITPFDPQNTSLVAKGIEKANLGFNPIIEGKAIRISIPPMDEARRKEMTTQAHKKREDCKVSIRGIRRDYNEIVKKQKNNGDIPEDLQKKLEKNIQELTDKFCKEADEATATKEKELLTV